MYIYLYIYIYLSIYIYIYIYIYINQINQLNLEKICWVGINDDARGTYNTNIQIKFKT